MNIEKFRDLSARFARITKGRNTAARPKSDALAAMKNQEPWE